MGFLRKFFERLSHERMHTPKNILYLETRWTKLQFNINSPRYPVAPEDSHSLTRHSYRMEEKCNKIYKFRLIFVCVFEMSVDKSHLIETFLFVIAS